MTKTTAFFQTEYIDDIFDKSVVIKDGILLPLEIELSLVDSCNRNCEQCPRGNEDIAPNTSLELTPYLYKKLAKELKELGFKGLVMLGGYGEPLLYKNILDVVKEFNFTYVGITTNGDLLTAQLIKEIFEAGAYKLSISVYEPKLMEPFKAMSKGYEDRVIIRNRYDNADELFNNRAGTVYENEKKGICHYPFYMVMVDANGDCFPCCHEWQRRLKVGNLYQHTLWEVWTSKDLKRVRKKILVGNRDLFPCRICNIDGTMRGKQSVELYIK